MALAPLPLARQTATVHDRLGDYLPQGRQLQTGENMTRKDYEAIASVILETRYEIESYYNGDPREKSAYDAMDRLERRLTALLSLDNPRFQEDTFHKACLGM